MAAGSEKLTAPLAEDRLERTVFRKVTLRLMPFLGLLYFFNILDRSNIDFARLQMLGDLGMSEWAYGLGAGVFYSGYCILEVPSNLVLSRVGARRWSDRCQRVSDEIVGYLRDCVHGQNEATSCALVVK